MNTSAPENRPSLRRARAVADYYVRGYHQLTVLRPCTLPASGGVVLVCNHISALDPVLIQAASPRPIIWMMAHEYYHIPAIRWFFQLIDAIPVQRSGQDLVATRAAFRALASGRVVGVFPEGRISVDGQVGPLQTGAALLATRAGVPVCPAFLEGTMRDSEMLEPFLYPVKARIAYGPLLSPTGDTKSRTDQEAFTDRIRRAMLELAVLVQDRR